MRPEEKIKEQRVIEAMRKDYMGKGGKFGCIVQTFGTPIYTNHSSLFETTGMDDPWDLSDSPEITDMNDPDYSFDYDNIPEFDGGTTSAVVGWVFDGLHMGYHLEIQYIDTKLSVSWQGFNVYTEESGDLLNFFPHADWEDKIEKLYAIAEKRQRNKRKEKKTAEKDFIETEKSHWLGRMWRKWGFK